MRKVLFHQRVDGFARREALFEGVVMGALRFAVAPAEPHQLAIDLAVEVQQAKARALEHRAYL